MRWASQIMIIVLHLLNLLLKEKVCRNIGMEDHVASIVSLFSRSSTMDTAVK